MIEPKSSTASTSINHAGTHDASGRFGSHDSQDTMMPKVSRNPITGLDLAAFGTDAASVIALRSLKIAAGGRAGRKEAKLMVSEKIAALAHVQWSLLSGAYGFTLQSMTQGVGEHYARAVRSNRKRLSSSGKR